jgi:hypothetical protein
MSATLEHPFLDQVVSRDGVVEPDRLSVSVVLRISKGELAAASGLSRDAVSKTRRLHTPATQPRLRDMAEVINHVLPRCGSVQQAFRPPRTWFLRAGRNI